MNENHYQPKVPTLAFVLVQAVIRSDIDSLLILSLP